MYDIGNMINVPANTSNHVVYLKNCQQGTVNGQPYWMAMNNSGYSVTLFTPYLKDNISISGSLGNDGTAYQRKGSFVSHLVIKDGGVSGSLWEEPR